MNYQINTKSSSDSWSRKDITNINPLKKDRLGKEFSVNRQYNTKELQRYIQKYPKLWNEVLQLFGDDTPLRYRAKYFIGRCKELEAKKAIRQHKRRQAERERKRRTRALIIFGKWMINLIGKYDLRGYDVRQIVLQAIQRGDFIQIEKGKRIDYGEYIFSMLKNGKAQTTH